MKPWKIEQRKKQYFSQDTGLPSFVTERTNIVNSDGVKVALLYEDNGINVANARLIAASPELLAFAQMALDFFKNGQSISPGTVSFSDNDVDAKTFLERLIAKATVSAHYVEVDRIVKAVVKARGGAE